MKTIDGLVHIEPINHLLKWQIIVLALTVFIIFLWQGYLAAVAMLFGGSIAVINTCLQKWHLHAAVKYARADASKNLGRVYRCVAERWLMTVTMFVIGFSVLANSFILLAGFIAMQFVVLFGNLNRA